jgi:hypothetical protein
MWDKIEMLLGTPQGPTWELDELKGTNKKNKK